MEKIRCSSVCESVRSYGWFQKMICFSKGAKGCPGSAIGSKVIGSVDYFTPINIPFISRWNNPLILTIDPNFLSGTSKCIHWRWSETNSKSPVLEAPVVVVRMGTWWTLEKMKSWRFFVTLLSPSWRSLNLWKGHLSMPKRSIWIAWVSILAKFPPNALEKITPTYTMEVQPDPIL